MEEPILILLGGLSGFIIFSFWWINGIKYLEKFYNEENKK